MLQIPIVNHNIEREQDVVDLFDKLLYPYLIQILDSLAGL